MATPEMILVETHGRVGLIRLNRPAALNALCDQLTAELGAQLLAFDADPRSGFAIYDTVGISQRSGWLQVGGTSAGAPQWAALIAIADQGRALVGNGSLDGVTPTLVIGGHFSAARIRRDGDAFKFIV